MSNPKPPRIPSYELNQLWETVHKRWMDEDRPSVRKIWFEEVFRLLYKLGYIKEFKDEQGSKDN